MKFKQGDKVLVQVVRPIKQTLAVTIQTISYEEGDIVRITTTAGERIECLQRDVSRAAVTTTFRIFRRSENRQSFGHRNYFLMDRSGLAFTAQRVYDLPLNGEFVATQDPETKEWNWAALGFEVPSPLTPPPPQNVIDHIFKPDAVKADLNACKME